MKKLFPLLTATFISEFGSALTIAALPVFFILSDRKDGMAWYNGFDSVGALIGAIWIMGLIDRYRKNWIAAISDIVRAIALIPLIINEEIRLSGVILYSVVNAGFGSATSSAIQAWIGEHFSGEHDLKRANSLLEIAGQIARASAPVVGVLILQKYSVHTIFLVDAVTYLIGAVLIARVHSQPTQTTGNSFIQEIRAGYAYCFSNKPVLRWISISGAQFFGLAIMNTVYLTILADWVKASPEQVTFFQTAYFVGAVIGSGYGVANKHSLAATLACSCMGLAFVMVGSIFVQNYWIFFALAAFQRAFTLLGAIATRSLCQRDSDPNLIGRVMAFRSASIDIFGIASYVLAIVMFKRISIELMLILGVIAFMGAAIVSLGKNA